MKKFFNRLITALLLAAVPTIFCTVISTPISYLIPVNCPQGSRLLGISCIDSAYNNTTPWYRRDIGPSLATLPVWILISLGVAWSLTSQTSPTEVEGMEALEPGSKRWLPAQCPYCGGSLSHSKVELLGPGQAKCPHCGGIIKRSKKPRDKS